MTDLRLRRLPLLQVLFPHHPRRSGGRFLSKTGSSRRRTPRGSKQRGRELLLKHLKWNSSDTEYPGSLLLHYFYLRKSEGVPGRHAVYVWPSLLGAVVFGTPQDILIQPRGNRVVVMGVADGTAF